MNKYLDIINLPHFVSKKHKHMSIHDRAAQFAPFSALTGYDDQIEESARITSKKIILDDEKKEEIGNKLNSIKKDTNVSIKYFLKDKYKDGGKYIAYKGTIRRIDKVNMKIIFKDKKIIDICDIVDVKIL